MLEYATDHISHIVEMFSLKIFSIAEYRLEKLGIAMMTKEGSTKIANLMTIGVGFL